jgi:uncharacterized protein (TIGR00645 family)
MNKAKTSLSYLIFLTRWLQTPLYLGLVVGLCAYIYRFSSELNELVHHLRHLSNNDLMLTVLNLIDAVMIANLLIMVIIGGYSTFVSPLHLNHHPDKPEWLDEVNAGTMKVKLAVALIAISSIHLLSTFIDPAGQSTTGIMWQVIIHMTLVVSAVGIALINILVMKTHSNKH